MSDQGIWFKLWCSSVDDSSLDNLDISDFGRWCKLGAYMKRHGTSGSLTVSSPARTLCTMFQVVDFSALHDVFHRLPNVETTCEKDDVTGVTIATVTFKNWQKYQGDNSIERVRKFRERVTAKKRREEKRGEKKRREEDILAESQDFSAPPKKQPIWPNEDLWLKNFLDTQTLYPAPREALDDPKWWENVAEVVNGINLPFLNTEFAKMGAWLSENKTRYPVKTSGWKKFTRGWLERAANHNRRNGHAY